MASRFSRRRAVLLATVAGALLVSVCAVAVGAIGGGSSEPQSAPPFPNAPEAVQSVPAAEAAAFGVLRRPRLAADQVPIGGELVERLGKGANVQLARRADAGAGTARWVIPAADGVCLTAQLDGAFSATCASMSDAQAGAEALTMTGGPGRGDEETTVVALAPDEATGATLELRDGSSRPLEITGNTVDATVAVEPTAIRWQTASGASHEVSVFTK